MSKITTFLWYDSGKADEAVDLYLSVFKSGKRLSTLQAPEAGPWKKGDTVLVPFEIAGQSFIAFNGGPNHPFTDAVSISVSCATQDEIDAYWEGLQAGGGKEIACGWLQDRFGLRWQIVPENIGELIRKPAAMKAMMNMYKLDKAALEAAAREPSE
jgi:predicted 3-demethylubiquinone-9 3-methyltransferase (glyoxalase superfamily)